MEESKDNRASLLGRDLPAKGIQPRVVLGLLLGGSLAGVWVTHVVNSLTSRIVTWLFVVSVGLLVGGLYWRIVFFDRNTFENLRYCRYVQNRWARLEAIAVWGTGFSGVAYLIFDMSNDSLGVGGGLLGTGLVCAAVVWLGIWWFPEEDSVYWMTALRASLLLIAFISLGAFAWLETGTTFLDWMMRLGHLGAFSLWIGGAFWHNFAVLPTVRTRPDAATSVKSQAQKFRRHLPVVIVILVVSGVYQTDRLIGLSFLALFESLIGQLIVLKLFILTVLTGLVIANYKRTA